MADDPRKYTFPQTDLKNDDKNNVRKPQNYNKLKILDLS